MSFQVNSSASCRLTKLLRANSTAGVLSKRSKLKWTQPFASPNKRFSHESLPLEYPMSNKHAPVDCHQHTKIRLAKGSHTESEGQLGLNLVNKCTLMTGLLRR